MKRALATVLVTLLTSACASIQPIPYSPQPSRIKDPVAETRTLILSNTVEGCIAEPDFSDAMLVVKFACTRQGVGNAVLRYDRVEGIELQQYKEWFRVLVHQRGAEDFAWTSKSKSDMERLADALTALTKPADAKKHTPAGATTL